jgi:hypothetical protein
MDETRRLAAEYRRATGKPLAVSSELAVYDAARLLDLAIAEDVQAGIDAIGQVGERQGRRYQIKARTIFDEAKGGQRIGQLKVEQEWDAVLLVLMDENYEPFEIYEADRATLEEALAEAQKSKRSKRGAMSVARFKIIAQLAWCRDEDEIDADVWDNQGSGD